MTQVGTVYGQALYELALSEGLQEQILQELQVLDQSFRQEPEFIRLLRSPNLSKQERCRILDDSFRGKVHLYLLNFLKILTERDYMQHFSNCCQAYTQQYHTDNHILSVRAVTAVPLTQEQTDALTQKLTGLTGKTILLENRVDPECLGGVRLDYDGQQFFLLDLMSERHY